MQTPKHIEELIKLRTAELQAIADQHERERQAFLQVAAQRQQKVTHLEGMILQLRALLPKPKGKDKTKKKK